MTRLHSRLWFWLRLLLTLGLVAALVAGYRLNVVLNTLRQLDWQAAAAGVLLVLWNVLLSSEKLCLLLRSRKLGLGRIFLVYWISSFYGIFLPSTVGGDVYKFVALRRHVESGSELLGAIFLERFSGLLVMTALCAFGSLLSPFRELSLLFLGWGAFGGSLLLYWLITRERPGHFRFVFIRGPLWLRHLLEKIETWRRDCRRLLRRRSQWVASLGLAVVFMVASGMIHWILARGLGLHLGFIPLLVVTALIQLITMAPLTINGTGLREWAFVFLLGRFGIEPEHALSLSLAAFAIVMFTNVLGGLEAVRQSFGKPSPVTPEGE